MLKPQKKITKKEIKEDKLVTTYFEAQSWLENNKRLAAYIVAAPVAIVLILFWWHSKRVEANDTTTTQLAKIISYYDAGQYDKAVNGVPQEGAQGLQAIVDENGSTTSGEIAKLYLANSYFALKNYDKALQYYDDVSLSDKMLTAAAYAGEAAAYEAKQDYEHAGKYFEKAASKNMTIVSAPDNLQRAAMSYAAAGQKDKAVDLLKTLKKEFPTSSQARDADRLLAEYAS
ncbi:MAG TPA: tetratricopeptide repeat protein [Bacteroidota bacterium]|nr:tetratricopeptide repeat protein [Bacteroidota bacterium]